MRLAAQFLELRVGEVAHRHLDDPQRIAVARGEALGVPGLGVDAVDDGVGQGLLADGGRVRLLHAAEVVAIAGADRDGGAEHGAHRGFDALRGGVSHARQRMHLDQRIEARVHGAACLQLGHLRHRVGKQLIGDAAHLSLGEVALQEVDGGMLGRARARKSERCGLADDGLGTGITLAGLGADFDAVNGCHGPRMIGNPRPRTARRKPRTAPWKWANCPSIPPSTPGFRRSAAAASGTRSRSPARDASRHSRRRTRG